MNRSAPLLLALLAGCGVAGADERPSAAPPPAEAVRFGEPDQVDVRGTVRSIELQQRRVSALSPDQRAAVAESMRILSVNCPFTRAAMQLPFALHQAASSVDPDRIDPLVYTDWQYLRHGLATHVAVLDALGVDLAQPAPGDHLHGRREGTAIDRRALAAASDPVTATATLVEQITLLVDQIDEPTMDAIRLHTDRVSDTIEHPWTLGRQLGGWENALRRVEPFAADLETQAQIRQMITTLARFGEQGC